MNNTKHVKNTVRLLSLNFKKGAVNIRNLATAVSNIIKSKTPNFQIPNIWLEDYVWKGLDKWHNKTALVCSETGRSYLYSDLYKNSKALRNVLSNFQNITQNDTLAIILPNVPEYPIIMLGAIEAGLKVTTLNPIYTADEIQKQLLDSETKIIFTLTDLWPKVYQATQKCKLNIPIVVIDHQNDQSTPREAIRYDELIERGKNLEFDPNIKRHTEDVILLPYSSGTTGVPKGVELTNKSIVSNLYQMAEKEYRLFQEAEGNHQEIVPMVLPMFHIYGMVVVMLNMLSCGNKLVSLPKFGSHSFIKLLNEFHPTFAYLAPPIVLLLLNNEQVQFEQLSSIKTIVSAAAPLGGSDVDRLNEKSRSKTSILQAYGLTETSPLTHIQTPFLSNGIKLGGCGLSIPNTECKIMAVDGDSTTALGPNKTGQLFIRGPQVMKGYRNNVKATEEVLDTEGWLKTGDIGYYDEDEQFFITDRLKELIKVKGYQVAPAELEELLRSYPDIEDAAVIGVPHKVFGEVPKAFVVSRGKSNLNIFNVEKYVAEKVANYKQLVGGIVEVDSIPKNPSGKILRRLLKEL